MSGAPDTRVDNMSYSSHYVYHRRRMDPGREWMMKGTAMLTLPYRTLMHYKRWATNGLNSVISGNLECLAADERILVLRLLDHVQAVDEIFRRNLEARPHGYTAPRS